MSRFHRMLNLLAVVALAAPVLGAEDPKTLKEVRELRVLVEKQVQQIETLKQQVAKLSQTIEAKPGPAAPPAPAAPTPAATSTGSAITPEFAADVPKAEAADGKRHVVIKGETLTSIAKHYNMPLAELQKANKEVDERKLQIGQTLTIPTPKTSEAPPEKRDTP